MIPAGEYIDIQTPSQGRQTRDCLFSRANNFIEPRRYRGRKPATIQNCVGEALSSFFDRKRCSKKVIAMRVRWILVRVKQGMSRPGAGMPHRGVQVTRTPNKIVCGKPHVAAMWVIPPCAARRRPVPSPPVHKDFSGETSMLQRAEFRTLVSTLWSLVHSDLASIFLLIFRGVGFTYCPYSRQNYAMIKLLIEPIHSRISHRGLYLACTLPRSACPRKLT